MCLRLIPQESLLQREWGSVMLLTSETWMTTTEGTLAIVDEANIAFVARRLSRDNNR